VDYDQLLKDLSTLFLQFKDSFFAFIPKLVFALIIVLIGIVIARLFKALVNRLIKNIDRLTSSKILKNRLAQIRLDRSTQLVGKFVYWIIIVLFLTAATEVVGLPIITTWLSGLVNYLPNILIATVIIFLGIIGGRLLRDFITNASATAGLLYSDVLGRIVQYAILIITVLIAVDQIGIDIAILTGVIDIILAAILFGAALAFGLGARTSISNILAAYYLQNMYKEGQAIRIGDYEGRIIQITSTAVVLETKDGQALIPAKLFSELASIQLKSEGMS